MNCKECVRHCKKERTPDDCPRFVAYEDSRKYEKLRRMMESNTGVDLEFQGLRGTPENRKYQAQAFYEGWDKKK